jgi:competence protein ComEC
MAQTTWRQWKASVAGASLFESLAKWRGSAGFRGRHGFRRGARVDLPLLLGCALLLGQRLAQSRPVIGGAGVHGSPYLPLVALFGAALALGARRHLDIVNERRRSAPHLAIALGLAVAASALGGCRAQRRVDEWDRDRRAVRHAMGAPARCEGVLRVVHSPIQKGAAFRFDAVFASLVCDDHEVGKEVVVRLYADVAVAPALVPRLARGDEVFAVASVAGVEPFLNRDLADPRPLMARSGVVLSGSVVGFDEGSFQTPRGLRRLAHPGGVIDQARSFVRTRIAATYAPLAAPMGRALVLGETDLTAEEDAAFRDSGLSHLLAVSGTHLVLAVASLNKVIVFFLRRSSWLLARTDVRRPAACLTIPLAFSYADFAGGSGSATRAATMMAVLFAATALGRRGNGVRALALSMLLGGLADPLAAFDFSFLLSLAATAGLMAFARPLEAWLLGLSRGRGALVIAPVATTVAATLACTPLLATMATTLPLAGVLANLVAVPVGELFALPACLFHAVFAWFPPLEQGLAWLGSGALLSLRGIALGAAHGATPMPPLSSVGLLALGACFVVWKVHPDWTRRHFRQVALSLAVVLVADDLALRLDGAPRGVVRGTHLDVGQGDSALLDLPNGALFLVDGGGFVGSPVDPGRSVILPTLRARRRSHLDVVVLSHPHPDHFLGLASALGAVPAGGGSASPGTPLTVGELWDTGQGEAEGAGPVYAALLAELRRQHVRIVGPAELCAHPRAYGEATVQVLAPCPSFRELRNANDNSLVFRVTYHGQSALFVGDAEREEEAELLARFGAALTTDVLKGGHHGSRTSTTPRFLAQLQPTTVVLSTGLRNRFGHPHPNTLRTLADQGLTARRTDEEGSITWVFR